MTRITPNLRCYTTEKGSSTLCALRRAIHQEEETSSITEMEARRSLLRLLPACVKEEIRKRPPEDPSGEGFVCQFHATLLHKAVSIKAAMKEPGARAAAEIKRKIFEKLAVGRWKRWSIDQSRKSSKNTIRPASGTVRFEVCVTPEAQCKHIKGGLYFEATAGK